MDESQRAAPALPGGEHDEGTARQSLSRPEDEAARGTGGPAAVDLLAQDLSRAVFEVQKSHGLIHYHLESEIDIPDLKEKVPITLVGDSDPDERISFVIDLPASIKTLQLITVGLLYQYVLAELRQLGVVPPAG